MIKKSISIIIITAFCINTCCYGQGLPAPRQYNLAPSSIFQKSFPSEHSKEFKQSILSDIKFLTIAFSIAAHFIIDGKNKQTLLKTLRDEFRNNREFLEGVKLESVHTEADIVYI
ncbi:MAG: hypothetical protein HQ547_06740, partial [Candidatus Omnitrophica bacterium]|nr:hypothetical protein [Candidatus Omnitrophota bacterium]